MTYSEAMVEEVWKKAQAFSGRDRNHWRKDQCGAWIARDQYDNATSEFGWKIAAVSPEPSGQIENLRAFHHANRFDIANGEAHCAVKADREDVYPTGQVYPPKNHAAGGCGRAGISRRGSTPPAA